MRNKVPSHPENPRGFWVRVQGSRQSPGREGEAFSPSSLCISPADPGAKPPGREVGRAPVAAAGQRDRRDQPQPRTSPSGTPSLSLAPRHPSSQGGDTVPGGGFSPQRAIWGMRRPKRPPKRRHPPSRSPRTPSASSPTRSWRSTSRRWRGKSWGCRVRGVWGEPQSQIPFRGRHPADLRVPACLSPSRREGHRGRGEPGSPRQIAHRLPATEPGRSAGGEPGPDACGALGG